MKISITIIFVFITTIIFGQDYYAVTIENENITYNYPEEAIFRLVARDGTSKKINSEESLNISADYSLRIDVPWSDEPEIIDAKRGGLQFKKLPSNSYKYNTDMVWDETMYTGETDGEGKPVLIKKNVFLNRKTDKIEGYFFFSNSMVFCYVDGVARAYQHNKKVDIEGSYLIEGTDALLKLSYNPKTGKMWYVFETNRQ